MILGSGCQIKEKTYGNYIEMMENNKGYEILRERTRTSNCMYAVCEKDNSNYSNDQLIVYDFKLGKCRKYDVGCVVNGLCADKNNVYYIDTSHNGENMSYITRINNPYLNGKKKKIYVDNIVLCNIDVHKDRLYVFGFDYNEDGVFSKMYIYDKNSLELIKEMNFSEYIIDVTDSLVKENALYVSGRSCRQIENGEFIETENKYICRVSLDNYAVNKIYIGDISYEIKENKDKIYVSNYDEVLDQGSIIYEVDEKKGVTRKHHKKEKVKDIFTYKLD